MSLIPYLPRILLVVVAAFLAWELRCLKWALASASWKRTRGLVSRAHVSEGPVDDDGDVSYSANASYHYTVGTRRYESRRLSYRPTSGLLFSRALDMLGDVRQGREVTVYFDPRKPERAVLIPGACADNVVRIGVLLVVLAVLVLGWF